MYSIFSNCLLTLIVISLFSNAFKLQQEQYAAAIELSQKMDITLVHSNTMDIPPMAENSSIVLQKQGATAAVKSFLEAFCGTNSSTTTPNSTRYITDFIYL